MSMQFTAGLALGEAFYDRKQERINLKTNINKGLHTVLIAPRRFGKTSLIKKVLDESDTPYLWLDFMTVTSKEEAQKRFLSHIVSLLLRIAKTEDRLKALITKYFARFKPEITDRGPWILKSDS